MAAVCSETGGAERNRCWSKHLHFLLGVFFLPVTLRFFVFF